MSKARTTMMTTVPATRSMFLPFSVGCSRLLHRLDGENETLAGDNADMLAGPQGPACPRAPHLALDPDCSLGLSPFHGVALGADHRFAAGDDAPAPGAQEQGERQDEESGGYDGCAGDKRQRQAGAR